MISTRTNRKIAVLMLAEIKAAVEDFDRGEINVFEALNRIEATLSPAEAVNERKRKAA